jgi:hypothetical protein
VRRALPEPPQGPDVCSTLLPSLIIYTITCPIPPLPPQPVPPPGSKHVGRAFTLSFVIAAVALSVLSLIAPRWLGGPGGDEDDATIVEGDGEDDEYAARCLHLAALFLALQRGCYWARLGYRDGAGHHRARNHQTGLVYRYRSFGVALVVSHNLFSLSLCAVCWTTGPTVTFCLVQSGAVLRRV